MLAVPEASLSQAPQRSRVRKKVAIVGGGRSRRFAPYGDPTWEIWAFSSRLYRYGRVDRWFEIHSMTDLRQQLSWRKKGRRSFAGYIRYMQRLRCPVYMQKVHPRIPNSVVFPKDQLVKEFGRCFTSTAAFLIALAIYEGYDEIGLWGIDVRGPRYARQGPAIRYLLAIAKQRGIKIYIPRSSRLWIPSRPVFPPTRVLYAYDWRSPYAWWRYRIIRRLRRRRRRRLGRSA